MHCRSEEFARLQHLLQHSLPDERICFNVNIISYLSQSNQKQLKRFSQNPSQFLKQLYQAVSKEARKITDGNEIINLIKYYNLSIQLTCIPYISGLYRKLGGITSEDVGKWVIISGTVVQCTQTKTLEKSKLFACNECGAQYRKENYYQTHYRFDLPAPCTNLVQKEKSSNLFTMFYKNLSKRKGKEDKKGEGETQGKKLSKCGSTKYSAVEQRKICVDYHQLRLQQQFKHITAGRLPQSVVVVVEGSVGSSCRPGDDIVVSGMLDYRFKKPMPDQNLQMQLIIVANTINLQKSNHSKDQDRQSLFQQTQESFSSLAFENFRDINRIAMEIQLRNAAIGKFCPGIFGRQQVKLGILLSLLGGVSIQNEQTKIRGQSHVLLVGQPGTGKSVILKQAANLAQRSFFTNGIGTSSAGLSVSYIKDGGDWTIQPGALVLADNGICCIDQLNLLSKKDENSLLEAMEQQTVSSAKASVVGRLNARTTLICACNPITVSQKYDPHLDLEVNTGLSIPLLTRFDLIMILKDEGGIAEDLRRCDHILDKFLGGQVNHEPHSHNFSLKQLLKKCKLYAPQLKGGDLLSKYYIEQRKNIDKVTTARAIQSLCRLSQAHAKLMMRDYTTAFDCLTAIMLTEGLFVACEEDYLKYAEHFCAKYQISLQECLQ